MDDRSVQATSASALKKLLRVVTLPGMTAEYALYLIKPDLLKKLTPAHLARFNAECKPRRLPAALFYTGGGVITIGRHETPTAYRQAISPYYRIHGSADRMVGRLRPAKARRRIRLEIREPSTLTIESGVYGSSVGIADVIVAAAKYGLAPCPREVGPALQLLHPPPLKLFGTREQNCGFMVVTEYMPTFCARSDGLWCAEGRGDQDYIDYYAPLVFMVAEA